MIIEPKTRGFICTTAHPDGCRENIKQQIEYVKSQPAIDSAKKVLVIGASAGYGLSSRISMAFSGNASTIGIIFDKPASGKRTASAGWYNSAAFEEFAANDGLYAKTINGDAFSRSIKEETIELIKQDLGKVDMVIYSLAAPRRTMEDGTTYSSVLKTVGEPYTNKTIDLASHHVSAVTISPATEEEIAHTVKVMGGEDWMDWIKALKDADAIETDAVTVAYSYIGPEVTHPMYKDGSIGMAKNHLFDTSKQIAKQFGIEAFISVNKALVTQSSAAIPIVPLYITVLYKIMKQQDNHEGCIEQMYRLFHDKLQKNSVETDDEGMIRLDDLEMLPEVQNEVMKVWNQISDENVENVADIDGYWEDFYRMFGFGLLEIDYKKDVEPNVTIPSIQ